MFIIGHFFNAIAYILDMVLTFYLFVVIARAVLSWVSPDPRNPIVGFINSITDPVMDQIRRRIPVVFGGIDLTPVIIIFAIMFIQKFLVGTLHGLAGSLM